MQLLLICNVTANILNCLKSNVDKYCSNQDILYDCDAKIQGTVSRSKVTVNVITVIFLN